MDMWNDVTKEDFGTDDDDMALLVDVVGLEITKKIIETFGGDSVYIPKPESVIRMGRDRRIYQEHVEKHINLRELAARYNLTPRHVRQILKHQKQLHREIKEEQMEMFNE